MLILFPKISLCISFFSCTCLSIYCIEISILKRYYLKNDDRKKININFKSLQYKYNVERKICIFLKDNRIVL